MLQCEIQQRSTNTLPRKKGIYIQLDNLPLPHSDDSFYEVVRIHPNLIQQFGMVLKLLRDAQDLEVVKGIVIIMKNASIIYAFCKDENFLDSGNITCI